MSVPQGPQPQIQPNQLTAQERNLTIPVKNSRPKQIKNPAQKNESENPAEKHKPQSSTAQK